MNMDRDFMKGLALGHNCKLEYDRSMRSWVLKTVDHRVHPIRITGVRYKHVEDIPYDLFMRLIKVQRDKLDVVRDQDHINERLRSNG